MKPLAILRIAARAQSPGHCTICGMPWPHLDEGHKKACGFVTLITEWRAEGYVDITDLATTVDVETMLHCAGIDVRRLPGRSDRPWAPAWAAQVAATIGDLKQEKRVLWIEKVNQDDTLRAAAEAVAAAAEPVLEVLRKAVTL